MKMNWQSRARNNKIYPKLAIQIFSPVMDRFMGNSLEKVFKGQNWHMNYMYRAEKKKLRHKLRRIKAPLSLS